MYSFQNPDPTDFPSLFASIVVEAIIPTPIPLPSSGDLPVTPAPAPQPKPRKVVVEKRDGFFSSFVRRAFG